MSSSEEDRETPANHVSPKIAVIERARSLSAALLAEVGVPVFARRFCIRGTSKDPDRGGIYGRLVIGGIEIRPQDLVVGDADDTRRGDPRCHRSGGDSVQKEDEIVKKVQGGQRTLDIYGFGA